MVPVLYLIWIYLGAVLRIRDPGSTTLLISLKDFAIVRPTTLRKTKWFFYQLKFFFYFRLSVSCRRPWTWTTSSWRLRRSCPRTGMRDRPPQATVLTKLSRNFREIFIFSQKILETNFVCNFWSLRDSLKWIQLRVILKQLSWLKLTIHQMK